jgi:hypothetical protein
MKDLKIDIFGFAEINKSMNNLSKQRWTNIIQKCFYLSRTTHSESSASFDSDYKPGGTLTTVTGKWQAQISEMGQDRHKLGRWSHVKISGKKASLIIITAYRPCKANGPMTAWMQQWSLLWESGTVSPNPIKQFNSNLEEELQDLTKEGHEILLMLDANEHIGERPGTFQDSKNSRKGPQSSRRTNEPAIFKPERLILCLTIELEFSFCIMQKTNALNS